MIWKRKVDCPKCKMAMYYDDIREIMGCGCGKFETKGIIKEMKKHLLNTKFEKTHSISLVFTGFEPCEFSE